MSLLGGFLRGALGEGMVAATKNSERRELEAAEQRRREEAKVEERRFREQQAERERDLKRELLGTRLSAKGGGSGGDGDGGGGGGDGGGDHRLHAFAAKHGITLAEARKLDAINRDGGANPYQRTVNDESGGHNAPDDEKFTRLIGALNKALSTPAGKNADKEAKAMESVADNGLRDRVLAGDQDAGLLGRAQAARDGKDMYGASEGVVYDKFSDKATVTPVGDAKIGQAKAAAAASYAEAGKDTADAGRIRRESGGKGASRTELIQERTVLSDQARSLDADVRAARAAVTDARGSAAKAAAQAELSEITAAREKVRERQAALEQRLSEGSSQPAGKAAPSADTPPANLLKEGVNTTFKNGQVWTLRGGKAVRVR